MIGVLPASWANARLSDVCVINPRGKSGLLPDDEVTFLPMAAVSEVSGNIIHRETRLLRDVDKGFTPFQEGDVLLAKITPCMENGKSAIAHNLINQRGYGSTEFHVIRPSALVLAEWVYAIVRTEQFRRAATSSFQGAVGQQRVPASFIAAFRIPIPALSEQRRIVEILHEAEEIRRLRSEASAKTADLLPSIFREFFGDLSVNSKAWRTVPVSTFVDSFQGGKSLTGIESEFDSNRPRVLKISAVTSGFLIPSESKALPSSYEVPEEHHVREGDLLITRANTEELVGATALVRKGCPDNLVLPDKIWRFVWADGFDGTPEFVWALFQDPATRGALSKLASGTGGSMKNISMAKLMRMRVVWPPKEVQNVFSQSVRDVLALSDGREDDWASQTLYASLAAHAFSGTLTAEWRETHKDLIAQEAHGRDKALQEFAAVPPRISSLTIQEVDPLVDLPTEGIYAELNREQRQLLRDIERMVGGALSARYFSARQLGENSLADGPLRRNPHLIEGHLTVLAAHGLIIPVSREEQTEDTGEFVFGNAYRLPLMHYEPAEGARGEVVAGDSSRLRELERLAAQIEKERMLP
jgi:type I restriction enzyme S subunit